jgi:hypothetical protein
MNAVRGDASLRNRANSEMVVAPTEAAFAKAQYQNQYQIA